MNEPSKLENGIIAPSVLLSALGTVASEERLDEGTTTTIQPSLKRQRIEENEEQQITIKTPISSVSEDVFLEVQRSPGNAPLNSLVKVLEDKEALIRMKGSELEEFTRVCRNSLKVLTKDQEKRLRSIRRQIKCREYAANTREKTRQTVSDLELQLNSTKAEVRLLREQVATLSARNVELEREITSLRNGIVLGGVGTGLNKIQQQLMMNPIISTNQHQQQSHPPASTSSRSNVAVSACLL